MYLQAELTNKAKELYFKYLKNEGMIINFEKLDHFEIKDLIKKAEKLDVPLGLKNTIIWIFSDLFQVLTNEIDENSIFLSNLAKNTVNKIKTANRKVKESLEDTSYEAKQLIEILKTFEENAYIVGGFVRDAISEREPNDVDFCTNIPYDKLESEFKSRGWLTKDTGKQFLVLNISHPITKEAFEIAALRKDKDNEGAEFGTIEEDAKRRDFTNSAVYFSIKKEKLIDPNGKGIKDCRNNSLDFVGKPKDRIKEDPNRVFRAYKMISRGWEPSPKTLKAIRENFDYAIKNTNSSRIMKELESICFNNN